MKPAPPSESEPTKSDDDKKAEDDTDVYLLAKSYFDLREYDRCAFFTEDSITLSDRVRFLHFYARYSHSVCLSYP